MATVRELVTKYGFEVNDKPLNDLKDTLQSVTVKVAAVAASFGVAAAAVLGVVAATAAAGDEAKATSQKLGITTEALGRLQYAASLCNLSAEGLQTAMKFLAKNSVEASTKGGEAADAFREIGVTLKDQNGNLKTADRLTLDLSDKFKAMPDGIKKSALAMKIFGRSGLEIIPFLDEGAQSLREMGDEAEAFGLIFTRDQADLADNVNDNFDRIKGAFKGLTYTIGKELLPLAKELTEEFIAFLKVNRVDILNGIRVAFSGLSRYLEIGWKMFKQLVVSAKGFVQLFGGFENVVKIFSVLSAVLAGGTLLYAIGAISTAVYGMAAAFAVADLVALAIPIAIGAAIIALGLIIEDVVTFFQGGESYLGDFVKYIQDKIPGAVEAIRAMVEPAMAVGHAFGFIFGKIYDVVSYIVSSVIPAFKFLGGVISDAFAWSMNVDKAAANGLNNLGSYVNGMVGPSSNVMNQNSSSVRVNAPINVAVGNNMSASQATTAVQSGIGDGLDTLLRGANRSYQGGVAY